jgi:hypothetical protein
MEPAVLENLIPLVAILAVFGMPVAILFVLKHFKLREREMSLEGDARKWAEQQGRALEQRVQRLEEVLISLDQDVRGKLGIGATTAQDARRELMEGPATPAAEPQPGRDPLKVR